MAHELPLEQKEKKKCKKWSNLVLQLYFIFRDTQFYSKLKHLESLPFIILKVSKNTLNYHYLLNNTYYNCRLLICQLPIYH